MLEMRGLCLRGALRAAAMRCQAGGGPGGGVVARDYRDSVPPYGGPVQGEQQPPRHRHVHLCQITKSKPFIIYGYATEYKKYLE